MYAKTAQNSPKSISEGGRIWRVCEGREVSESWEDKYGQFSKFHVWFCGLDSGNLKFETVRTNRQRICFWDLRRSIEILRFEIMKTDRIYIYIYIYTHIYIYIYRERER